MPSRLKSLLLNTTLVVVSMAVCYLAIEAGYRFYRYRKLTHDLRVVMQADVVPGSRYYVFAPHVGYRFLANREGYREATNSRWRTNSHGHVSQFEYPQKKPAGEYRIAVIGDSMTAGTFGNVRWTEVSEDQLNAAPAWKASVGKNFTRVINFGVDGFGMQQFAGMVCHYAMDFEPDLIIVNFITDDLLRTLRYQGDNEGSAESIIKTKLNNVDWFRVYPELFARTVGRLWNMESRVKLRVEELLTIGFRYDKREDALTVAAAAVRDIARCAPRVLFVHMPTIEELDHAVPERELGLLDDLQKAVPDWSFVSMKARMEGWLFGKDSRDRADLRGLSMAEITALPKDRWPELYRWFNLPDLHHSDYGATLYGREVAQWLIERPTTPPL